MDVADKKFLIKHGFQEDINKKMLFELFASNYKLKSVNMSISFTDPFMLLARNKENNVKVEVNTVNKKRLILKKNETVIMNILLDEINLCLTKNYNDKLFEFQFEIKNMRYSLDISV